MSISTLFSKTLLIIFVFREVEDGPHVVWFDNYNKMFRKQIASMTRDQLALCMWNGYAVRPYKGRVEVSMKVKRLNYQVVPAMPQLADLWSRTDAIDDAIISSTATDIANSASQEIPLDFLDNSLYAQWGADRVPLKPDKNVVPEEYKAAIENSPDTLENFFPKGLIEHNVGSNVGLARVMRKIYDEKKMGSVLGSPTYIALNVDLNIFYRLMKVLSCSPHSLVHVVPSSLILFFT